MAKWVGLLLLGAIVIAAGVGPVVSPYDPLSMSITTRLLPPGSPGYLLGTDQLGRDVLTRLMMGGRLSLLIGASPVLLAAPFSIALGLASGFYGGWIDQLIGRVLDVLFAFPAILLAIAIVSILGPGIPNAVMTMAILEVPTLARIVRAPVLTLREREYILAARVLGASDARILVRHVLANVLSPVAVFATVELGSLVLFASALSFLGLGPQPPAAEWGLMLAEGRNVLEVAPWVATVPGLAILLTVLAFNFLADALRDFMDPRVRTRRARHTTTTTARLALRLSGEGTL